MNRFFLSISLILFGLTSFAQQSEPNPLPKGLAPEEVPLIPSYTASRATASAGITNPPTFPVRTMAEWEEIDYLMVNWRSYVPIVREIIRHAVEEADVIVVCTDSNAVRNNLVANGIPVNRVHYLQNASNTLWIRDYGANTIYRDDVDSLMLVDWIYNRPRPQDDVIPDAVSNMLSLPLYSTTNAPNDLVHTGGNFHIDGLGTAFSSELILEENGPTGQFNQTNKTEAQIDSLMGMFMGIDRYIKMPVLPYDAIHHIDMHMRLLDEETLLVGEYPTGVADGPQIEANLQYVLSNFNSIWGTPYKVVRMQMPPDGSNMYPDQGPWWDPGEYRTYTNNVFVNKTLLVPVYEEQYDSTALRILREQLPGYKVVGIDCNSIIPASGALHCITRAIGSANPLLIAHQPLPNTNDTQNPYPVEAMIKHRDGIGSATLHYTTDTSQGYIAVPMTFTNMTDDTWTGFIPAQTSGSEVFYYVEAEATSGKTQVRPMPAPSGYWNFEVGSLVALEEGIANVWEMEPVFPNPARAITCIPVNSPVATQGRIVLVDLMGKEIQKIYEGEIPAGESKYFFFADKVAAGAYFVVMDGEMGRQTRKVMVR